MSLQVRLRHTLGERLLELPDRPVDEPVVVGRWSGADVQVPSVTVSQRHCVLFVHEGRWAIQPTGGAGTFVNGGRVEGPAALHVGDVVTLGPEPNAPTLEIDPLGAAHGRKGQPAIGLDAPVTSAVAPALVPAPRPEHPPEPGYQAPAYSQHGYAAPAPATTAWTPAGATGETSPEAGGDMIAWPTAGTATITLYGRRRPRRSSGTGLALFLTVLLVGGAGYYVYRQYQQQQSAMVTSRPPSNPAASRPTAPTPRRVEEHTLQFPDSIFDKTAPQRTAKGATRPATQGARAQAGPVSAPTAGPGAVDATMEDGSDLPTIGVVEPIPRDPADATTQPSPEADDPAWKQVLAARFSQDEAKAILKFEEYARSHPDQFRKELAEYTDRAMDRLWFERLEQLCKQRDEAKKNVEQTDRELAEETDEAYKKRVLAPLKEKYANRLQSLDEELKTEMKYDGAAAPNVLDEAEVEKLRKQRDPSFYANWKNRVLSYIRRSHGELPWGST